MSLDKRQIYIVDDDESICRALKFLLGTYEFQVETFNSAEDFFNAVPNSAPGCLILDIHMPGIDGWEVQRRLVASGCERSVIVISADKNGGHGYKEQALKAGVMGFLQKPFNDQEIVNLINQVFQK